MSNPFNVLAKQLDDAFTPPWVNRSAVENAEIIGNEMSSIVQGIPEVGGVVDTVDSTISSSISAFQNLLTNPVGATETLLQGFKVRKVINNFFDGIDGLVRNGKLISKGNAIQVGTPKVENDYNYGVISRYTDVTPTGENEFKVKRYQSSIYSHKGHGFTYDAKGEATASNETTELGDIKRYPSYASIKDFFKTTIGTDFYWGIKVETVKNLSYDDLPKPVFCDESKNYKNKTGFYFEGWLPAQTYQFSEYISAETEELSAVAFTLALPSGHKLGNKITTQLIDTDAKDVSEWLEAYRAFTNPSPKIVLPYKNCVYQLVLYTYRPSGELIRRYPFYAIPDTTQALEGDNNLTASYPSITWFIVGKEPSSNK